MTPRYKIYLKSLKIDKNIFEKYFWKKQIKPGKYFEGNSNLKPLLLNNSRAMSVIWYRLHLIIFCCSEFQWINPSRCIFPLSNLSIEAVNSLLGRQQTRRSAVSGWRRVTETASRAPKYCPAGRTGLTSLKPRHGSDWLTSHTHEVTATGILILQSTLDMFTFDLLLVKCSRNCSVRRIESDSAGRFTTLLTSRGTPLDWSHRHQAATLATRREQMVSHESSGATATSIF